MQYTFYILHSTSKDRYYFGRTGDEPEERLQKHNTNHKGFTGNTGDWKIVFTEMYTTKEDRMPEKERLKNGKQKDD